MLNDADNYQGGSAAGDEARKSSMTRNGVAITLLQVSPKSRTTRRPYCLRAISNENPMRITAPSSSRTSIEIWASEPADWLRTASRAASIIDRAASSCTAPHIA
jgi:hypothetical protein